MWTVALLEKVTWQRRIKQNLAFFMVFICLISHIAQREYDWNPWSTHASTRLTYKVLMEITERKWQEMEVLIVYDRNHQEWIDANYICMFLIFNFYFHVQSFVNFSSCIISLKKRGNAIKQLLFWKRFHKVPPHPFPQHFLFLGRKSWCTNNSLLNFH